LNECRIASDEGEVALGDGLGFVSTNNYSYRSYSYQFVIQLFLFDQFTNHLSKLFSKHVCQSFSCGFSALACHFAQL